MGRPEFVHNTYTNDGNSLPAGQSTGTGDQPQADPQVLGNSSPTRRSTEAKEDRLWVGLPVPENSSHTQRSTTAGENQTQINLPAPDKTTSKTLRKSAEHTNKVCRPKGDESSDPAPLWEGHMQINTGPTDKNCSNTYQIGETNNISLPPSPLLEKPDQDRMTNHANSAVRDGTTTKNQQESPKYATVVKDDDRDGTLVAKQTPSFHTKYYQKTRTKNPIQMPPRGTLTKTLN